GSRLEYCISRLRKEIRREKISLRPYFYLSDFYGCVTRQANVGLAFYDADPLLQDIRREVTGEFHSEAEIMDMLRHEFGHAFCYTHRLYQEPEFRRIFGVRGDFFRTYPAGDRFKSNPWSRNYVNLNGDHYAQKHPDEDFAETVATFVDRRSRWRVRYRNKKGALQKLEYVGRTLKRYGRRKPKEKSDPDSLHLPVEQLKKTVGEFFGASPTPFRKRAKGYIDPKLRRLFRHRLNGAQNGKLPVSELIRVNRRTLLEKIGGWTEANRSVVRDLLDKIVSRSDVLGLAVRREHSQKKLLDLATFTTTLVTNYTLTNSYLP
ncbi:MAG: putative zinc-binding metallopeptidase, partial [Planctomycetota bacterium]|nr:putative zinc-binding metallopeptidase [Planctomycetota bacterium]